MSIPHCFDPLLGVKPKHLHVNLLSQAQESVDEVAPLSQIPGLNLTQFNEIGSFRSNLLDMKYPNTQTEHVGQKTYSTKFK